MLTSYEPRTLLVDTLSRSVTLSHITYYTLTLSIYYIHMPLVDTIFRSFTPTRTSLAIHTHSISHPLTHNVLHTHSLSHITSIYTHTHAHNFPIHTHPLSHITLSHTHALALASSTATAASSLYCCFTAALLLL